MFGGGILIQIAMVAGLFAAAWGGLAWLEKKVEENAAAKVTIQTCATSNESLRTTIDDQNRSLKDVKEAADRRVDAAEKEADRLRADAKKRGARADSFLAAQPSNTGDLCESARKLLSDYARERQAK